MSKKIVVSSNTSWSIYNFRFGLIKKLQENGYEKVKAKYCLKKNSEIYLETILQRKIRKNKD